ncbi:MAG: SRPBCC domain-containing protein [Acetobacteraceae bacterium]|jgi:carbon monoxide dehydrogenase subunit G
MQAMDMTGERRIPAPRQVVWNALNDPDVLRVTLPGCESLEMQSDTAMKATASVKIGPISARFTGHVELSDIDPPNGYTISGEGQGGVAGFAKGGAKVKLDDDDGATLLRYEVHAQVGGKLAQLGARLVDASAKQLADQFFDRFSARVAPAAAAAPAGVAAAPIELAARPVPVAAPQLTPAAAGPVVPGAPASSPQQTGPATTQIYPAAPGSEVARPVLPPPYPQAPISIFALIPREPFGLPIAAWIGGVIYLFIVLLFIGAIF